MQLISHKEIVDFSEKRLKIRVHSCEFEIILLLYDVGPLRAGEILTICRASSTNFYSTLKRLVADGILIAQHDITDRRLKRYALTEAAERSIDDHIKAAIKLFAKTGAGNIVVSRKVSNIIGVLEERFGIRCFYNEYNILMNLYDSEYLSSNSLLIRTNISITNLYQRLKGLERRGVIRSDRDERDHRRKRYHLSDWVRTEMKELRNKIREWFLLKEEFKFAIVQASSGRSALSQHGANIE